MNDEEQNQLRNDADACAAAMGVLGAALHIFAASNEIGEQLVRFRAPALTPEIVGRLVAEGRRRAFWAAQHRDSS